MFSQLQTSVVNAGKKIGVGIHTFNNNGSLPTTVSNLSTIIAEHPSAIIEYNPISAGGSRIGASIKASGIPCVAVNFPIPNCHYFNEDIPYLAKQLAGVFAGEMHKRGWTGNDTEVMLVEVAGAGGVNAVLWDMYAGLATQVSGMNHIKASSLSPSTTTFSNDGLQVNTDVSVDAAYTGFATALQSVPKDERIVVDCLSDDQCLGAYRALSASGRLDNSMISGFSADPQAIKMLRTSKAWVARRARTSHLLGRVHGPDGDRAHSGSYRSSSNHSAASHHHQEQRGQVLRSERLGEGVPATADQRMPIS